MADTVTNNLQLLLMQTGSASGTWGSILNTNVFTLVDQVFGNTLTVPVSSSDVTLTMTQRQNLAFKVTGTATANLSISLPLNANSTTLAVGGIFIFDNQATGAFAITVKTVASGSTGVAIPQGVRSAVYSDGTNVTFADDAQNQTQVYNGNPNGFVAGKAGSVATRASKVVDYSANLEYLCTTSGTASSAVWSVNLPFTFPCQGFLTPSSDTVSPVLTADSIGATTIYLTGIQGNQMFLYNGLSFVPNTITGGQLSLALSSSSQAATGLYDVIGFLNGTSTLIGFSPAWQTPTVAIGARGTGAGSPQLTRVNGLLVNAVSQTVNNGATTYAVAASRGLYIGSVFVDATPGQVTCHVSWGQSRKWGIWNYYNRKPILLQAGDSTASWAYNNATARASNGSSANSLTVFTGFAEEGIETQFTQNIYSNCNDSQTTTRFFWNGIGWNSTTAFSARAQGAVVAQSNNSTVGFSAVSKLIKPPFLGLNVANCMEQSYDSTSSTNYYGGQDDMVLSARYNG